MNKQLDKESTRVENSRRCSSHTLKHDEGVVFAAGIRPCSCLHDDHVHVLGCWVVVSQVHRVCLWDDSVEFARKKDLCLRRVSSNT